MTYLSCFLYRFKCVIYERKGKKMVETPVVVIKFLSSVACVVMWVLRDLYVHVKFFLFSLLVWQR